MYSVPDFYDMLEMMDVNAALREDSRRRSQKNNNVTEKAHGTGKTICYCRI